MFIVRANSTLLEWKFRVVSPCQESRQRHIELMFWQGVYTLVIAMRLIMMLCNMHLIMHRLTNQKTPLSILNDTYQTTGDNPQGTEIGVRCADDNIT